MNSILASMASLATMPRVFTGLVSHTLRKALSGTDLTVDQPQSNGMWAVHQFRLQRPGDPMAYRVIIAPANAPVFIGEVSADLHFAEPLAWTTKPEQIAAE